MSGFNKLSRKHVVFMYGDNLKLVNLGMLPVYDMDNLIIVDDSEWDTSLHRTDNIDLRQQDDLISHQYILKYKNYPAMAIVIYRKRGDPPFSFWDMLSVIRYYLNKVGYRTSYTKSDYRRFAKQLSVKKDKIVNLLSNSYRVPPVVWVGYFSGVDLTAYYDWRRYLDMQDKSRTDPNFININKQEFFSQPYSIMIKNPHSRRIKYPITIQFADTMALGPQGGLAALGNIVGQKKLNTKSWDLEDGLITNQRFNDPFDGGYYKSHMRTLLEKRPDDYQAYALGDSEVTIKYFDFVMGNVIDVYNKGLIKRVHIPATITSLADEISSHYSQLPYDHNSVTNIYNDIFDQINVNQFLRPVNYNQLPPQDAKEWQAIVWSIDHKLYDINLFIHKLKPYLARGTLSKHLDADGNIYVQLNVTGPGLLKRINFQKLYHDNPRFKIDLLIKQVVKVSKPKLTISSRLRNQYADHAHQIEYTRNNVPTTIDDLMIKLHNDSVYSQVIQDDKEVKWSALLFLAKHINFDRMRKGYGFVEPKATDRKHKKGSHDRFSVRPDTVYNDGFEMVRHAYVGGMNLAFNPGIITDAFKFKFDIDLKSSYVNAGHLIPDFRLDVIPILDQHDVDIDFVTNYRQHPNVFPNGPFTIGVANISYHFPDNVKRVPVGYKPPLKDQGPVYVRQANRVDMTLTDTISLIEHGATVRIHRLIIPQQKALDGTVNTLAPIGKMQHWSLMERNKTKNKRDRYNVNSEEYRKYDSLQLFYKLLGNGGYGKSAEGLGSSSTRDFITGQTMYMPFSRNTNPFTASQYTSIARYQVNQLMDLVEKLYPNSLLPSVTTDGFIFCTNDNFKDEELQEACKQNFDNRWITVNHRNFNDQYFELKSHNHGQKFSTKPLINIRTRFNITTDNHIKALVGLKSGEWTCERLIKMLKDDVVTFKVEDFRMISLNDLKHRYDNKRYVSSKTWKQPKYLNLSPDDTYEPIGFVPQGKFGYYLTRPFASIEDVMTYRDELKPYRSLFPAFRKEYAEQFLKLNQSIGLYERRLKTERHVSWVHDDVSLSSKAFEGDKFPDLLEYYQTKYVPQEMLRFIVNHQAEYDLRRVYQDLFSDTYKRFSGFNQALKRDKGKFVNPLCVIKEDFYSELMNYKLEKEVD